MSKRALLIAYHYPPVKGSSGLQRALKASRYLRGGGWDCDVLTVWPRAYEATGDDEIKDIPDDVEVVRAIAFDAKRHLSLMGSYPRAAAVPDRWSSWAIDGVRRGKKMLARKRYDAIWSTYPIYTAHRIGLALSQHSGLPWVADCRDQMTEPGYPSDPWLFKRVRALENEVVHNAQAVVFTAPGAQAMYASRYPDLPADRWQLIENGYDEAAFDGLPERDSAPAPGEPLTLVHAGILYPAERDPKPFFQAVAALKATPEFSANPFRVILRATGHDEVYRQMLIDLSIDDVVRLEPGVPYREALGEMLRADGLVIFQAASCNHQIPAKAYEYLRAGRPILALTDATGNTAGVLRDNQQRHICDLTDAAAIERCLKTFLEAVRAGEGGADRQSAERYSRKSQTLQLAALFDRLSGK